MKPIKAPRLTENGIVLYVPPVVGFPNVKVEIFYSPKNPLFAWAYCEGSPQKIWEKIDTNFDKGIMFIYNRNLLKGFYKVSISMSDENVTQILRGSEVYGLLKEKPTLYIGLPYSTFSTISVS